MPIQVPFKTGDVVYPQYCAVISKYIKNALQITKGLVYTADSAGRLILPISTSGVADLTNGMFQAMATPAAAPTAEDTDTVQVLAKRSRIVIKADVNLVVGSEVELFSSGSTTTADKCMAAVQPKTKGYLGTIIEILSQSTPGVPNKVTSANDLVVVDTGLA